MAAARAAYRAAYPDYPHARLDWYSGDRPVGMAGAKMTWPCVRMDQWDWSGLSGRLVVDRRHLPRMDSCAAGARKPTVE